MFLTQYELIKNSTCIYYYISTIFIMKNLKNFETEEEFLKVKGLLKYPTLSYTNDNSNVWICNTKNYIIATYNVRDVNESIDLINCNKNYNERLDLDYEISNIYILTMLKLNLITLLLIKII